MQVINRAHGHIKSHYHKHYRSKFQERAHFVFMLDAFLVTAALGLLGLGCYFRWFYHPLSEDFKIELVTEREIVGGKDTTISVRVVNGGVHDLHDAQLTFHLPDNFVSSATETPSTTFEISFLPAKASGEYRFRGTLLGPPQAAKVFGHFRATDETGREDEKLVTGDLRWEKSLIETTFEAPATVVPGQMATFRLHVHNGSAIAFENASVALNFPKELRLINSTPPVYRGAVALGRLEAGDDTAVDFTARFQGAVDLTRLEASLMGAYNGRDELLASASADVHMAAAGLEFSTVFAGETPSFVTPGQEVPVVVRYRNAGERAIKDLSFSFVPDARTIASVRWETSAAIGEVKPGESGERKAFVLVRDPISQYVVNPTLRMVPLARFSIDEPKVDGAEVAGAALETKISGAARLRATARFFTAEGDQIGRGPLPPRVSSATRYWVFAGLETGATEIENGVITFTLPDHVAWTGRGVVTRGEDLKLEGNRLVWRLGTSDAHSGVLTEAPNASFEVALTPSTDMVGQNPLILAQSAFSGTDSWTGEALTSSQGGLTTQLPGDPGINGRSVVR